MPPAGAADGPTMGANCHHFLTTDAMGWLIVCGWDRNDAAGLWKRDRERAMCDTRSTQVQGPLWEVTPLVLLELVDDPGGDTICSYTFLIVDEEGARSSLFPSYVCVSV